MDHFWVGAAVVAVIAGAVWMYRAWIVAEAATIAADGKQAASKVINKL